VQWAPAQVAWIDLEEALAVIPADSYRSDHVHVLPLVPQAIEVLKSIPKPKLGRTFPPPRAVTDPYVACLSFTARGFAIRSSRTPVPRSPSALPHRPCAGQLRPACATTRLRGRETGQARARAFGWHGDGDLQPLWLRARMRRALEQWANELTSIGSESQAAQARDSESMVSRAA
jgi:hypothetical protein